MHVGRGLIVVEQQEHRCQQLLLLLLLLSLAAGTAACGLLWTSWADSGVAVLLGGFRNVRFAREDCACARLTLAKC